MGITKNGLFHRRPMLICVQFLFLGFFHTLHADLQTEVVHLRTEYRLNPLGLDAERPRLSWQIISERRGVMQTAYEIQAASTEEDLAGHITLLWESGKVVSGQSIHVRYCGPELRSGQRIYWRVRIWTGDDKPSGWSEASWWETGLSSCDWQASWISPAWEEDTAASQPSPYLRKEFTSIGTLVRARLYITSYGLYQAQLNGEPVCDWLFTPGWTSYNKRLQYQTYDITDKLHQGENCLGVVLGDGWYRGYLGWQDKRNNYGKKLALLAQIQLDYADGRTIIVSSDSSWRTATGPILASDIYHGETYDARLELDGWSSVGFPDETWSTVREIEAVKQTLIAQSGPPVRRMREIRPLHILQTPRGETVYDFGQNMVGWLRLKVSGPAGAKVTLKHAEVLDKEGNFYTGNLRIARQTVVYTLKGGSDEVYEPLFTFQGFRYVSVEGLSGEWTLDNLTGIVIYSDMNQTGTFTCSDSLVNRLQQNIVWGQRGNFLDVPTDCPQRDERMGWTGDAQVFAPTACFNMDVAAFFSKWLGDLSADQDEDGRIPWVVPDVLGGGGSAAWADAGIIVPWTLYIHYGDKAILQKQFDSMRSWVEYMRLRAGNDLLWTGGTHFGDWLAFATTRSDYPGATTEKDLIATAFFAHSTELLAKTAAVLGKRAESAVYHDLADSVKTAFCAEFVTPNGRLVSHTQTAYGLALAFDLLPESLRQQAAARLAADIRKFGHLTTGFVGTPLLCPVLSAYGYTDLAYELLMRKAYPSWLYPVTRGATTIWERWDGIKTDGSFQDEGMNSFNHYAYGAIGEWLYSTVAGLNPVEQGSGYKEIIFQPQPGGGLTSASARLETMFGTVLSEWTISEGVFTYHVTLPPNTRGKVVLSGTTPAAVTHGDTSHRKISGVEDFKQQADGVIIFLGSGDYSFSYPWNQ